MKVDDIRVFMPSQDFDASKTFYSDLGFNCEPVNDELALFSNGECTFFLQRFYNKELAENLMLQICVLDIQSAYEKATAARHKTKISEIHSEHWGEVFYVWGPSGELLHVTQLAR
jgi:predicted enzyme related to lactoylglutathione lyase